MNEFWPPPAPPLRADFEKVKEEAKPALEAAAAKEKNEDLQPKPKTPAPKLVLNPPGMRPSPPMNIAQQERMQRRLERIQKEQEQQKQARARDAFGRAAGREC
jgi:hypothetical protein